MLFAGFGFLMTFLSHYGYSAISFTIIITATITEFAILLFGFSRLGPGEYLIPINFIRLETFRHQNRNNQSSHSQVSWREV